MGVVRFALLGLGAGAVYALTAQGIVLIYRGSGVLSFAHGAVGMVGAFCFYLWRDDGMPTLVALGLALAMGAAIGAGIHLLVMRPLRRAPALSRLIATLGLFTFLLALGMERWGDSPRIVAKLLPIGSVEVLPDAIIGEDRLWLVAIAVVLTIVLAAAYRWTRFGLATTAVAENRRATATMGISPDVVATANWAIGSLLAVAAAILIVNVTGLQVLNLTLLVVPGFAAALVGGFRSFPLTLAGGLLIGILESEVAFVQTKVDDPATLAGWGRSVPFLVIIAVLVLRGRALPLRSDAIERPPAVGDGRVQPRVAVPLALAAMAVTNLWLSADLVEAMTTTATVGIVVLSLTVVTGYAGQLSLAQFALAGTGAWIASRLVVNYDVPFEVAAIAGIVGAVPVGLVVGLPALRSRGVNLAVATLGLSLVLESIILNNARRTGGLTGTLVGTPTFFGIDLDTNAHPERYAVLALACFTVVAFLVANLRRGRAGRRLIAVRTNERAAAALGISVVGVKLYAFGLAAAIAAVGGVLMAFRRPSVVFYPAFSIFESIIVIVYGVIGGVGFVSGALLGASLAPGGLVPTVFDGVLGSDAAVRLVLGALVVVVLLRLPNGLASLRSVVPARWRGRRRRVPGGDLADDHGAPAVVARTLVARDVTVRYGAVTAVDGVSLTIQPGKVLGLIGPNGAGKTTLIDALTGFVRPADGDVVLDDVSVARWSSRRRAVAGVGRSFQSLELFESMTVRENLRTACDQRDWLAFLTDLVRPSRAPLGAAASAVVREFGLEDDLDRRPEELSFGKRRLVALARAVAVEPSILLLDEPAAGLGEAETAELGALLRRLASEWGIGVLLVEHDVSLVLDVCDHVAVLAFGRLIADGAPDAIRTDPVVVAAYLGDAGGAAPTARAGAPTPAGPPLLSASSVAAGYGDLAAVRDLDLTVHAGEVVALLGANGAGKSTTLLALAGELPLLDGELRWNGDVVRAALHRRAASGTALVPEERAVIRSLTAGENLRLAGVRADDACALFPELEPLLGRRAGLLSGGEQQMLILARALARNPALLLADELSLGLAPIVVQRLLVAVREAANRGVAVVVVEQHARQVLEIADHVIVLRRGRVVLSGTATEMLGRLDEVERAYLTGVG